MSVDLYSRAELLEQGAGLLALGASSGVRSLARVADALAAPARPDPVWSFPSRPDLRPPRVTIRHRSAATADGFLFLAPSSGPGQRGTLILDDDGEVVWFQPTRATAMNFRPAIYRGKPVLTWWEGKAPHGLGEGECVIADDSYRELLRFRGGGHRPADLHELLITPDSTALITLNEHVTRDLTAIGGRARHGVIGGVAQELALPSGRVLYEWRSIEHVDVEESHAPRLNPWDYFHINSIDLLPDGDLLISARNTWTVYKVDRRTGRVLWRLGGKKSDFAMGPGTVTAWQHDARLHGSGNVISIFDNGAAPQVQTQTRGLVVELDTKRMRARLLHAYVHRPRRIVSRFMGSVQLLPNGNVLMGWGGAPFVTEFARDGRIRLDAHLPAGGMSYRAFRFPWVGHPSEPPRLASRAAAGERRLHASWNGATEVTHWRVETGTRRDRLRPARTVPRTGFETVVTVARRARYAAVVALGRAGRPLGRSATIRV